MSQRCAGVIGVAFSTPGNLVWPNQNCDNVAKLTGVCERISLFAEHCDKTNVDGVVVFGDLDGHGQ
jgi:hypothetical protein